MYIQLFPHIYQLLDFLHCTNFSSHTYSSQGDATSTKYKRPPWGLCYWPGSLAELSCTTEHPLVFLMLRFLPPSWPVTRHRLVSADLHSELLGGQACTGWCLNTNSPTECSGVQVEYCGNRYNCCRTERILNTVAWFGWVCCVQVKYLPHHD